MLALPPELLTAILTNLPATSDLCTTSRVSREWRQCVQPMIFRKIQISSSGTSRHNLASFIALLRSSCIGEFVQRITLDGYDVDTNGALMVLSRCLLVDLLCLLPRLQHITLRSILFRQETRTLRITGKLFSLESLALDDICSQTGDVADLLDCLGVFAHLGTLSIRFARFNDFTFKIFSEKHPLSSAADTFSDLSVSNLQLADLDLESTARFCGWFAHSRISTSLQSLSFNPLPRGPCDPSKLLSGLRRLLADAAPQLQHLEMRILQVPQMSFDKLPAIMRELQQSFASLAVLRTCTIRLTVLRGVPNPAFNQAVWSNLIATLSTLPHNVQHIELLLSDLASLVLYGAFLYENSIWLDEGFDLYALQSSLTRFGKLATIRIRSSFPITAEEQMKISQTFSQLRERGTFLHFD